MGLGLGWGLGLGGRTSSTRSRCSSAGAQSIERTTARALLPTASRLRAYAAALCLAGLWLGFRLGFRL